MRILINCSNLSGGGGVQAADSVIRLLNKFPFHQFTVVLPVAMEPTANAVRTYANLTIIRYNYPQGDLWALVTNRNKFLDSLVEQDSIECVLTMFGPMKWKPKCRHVTGFALAHVVLKDSPFYMKLKFKDKLKWKIRIKLWELIFRRSSNIFYTENEFISERLRKMVKGSTVTTISNYYNQIFDNIDLQRYLPLPAFDGFQLLDIASAGIHKNQEIALDIARVLKKEYPKIKFRFVFTLSNSQFPDIPNDLKDNFLLLGPVSLDECPSLYEQVDASFQPTLLECFTATYVESMRMGKPIITTNLGFARSLCEDAAIYYDAMNPVDAAKAIYKLISDKELYCELVNRGRTRLTMFDCQLSRAKKLINLCENNK